MSSASKLKNRKFRAVPETYWEVCSAYAAGYVQHRVVVIIKAGTVSGPETLAGGVDCGNKGQAQLAAVGVACQGQVYAAVFEIIKKLGLVHQDNLEIVVWFGEEGVKFAKACAA